MEEMDLWELGKTATKKERAVGSIWEIGRLRFLHPIVRCRVRAHVIAFNGRGNDASRLWAPLPFFFSLKNKIIAVKKKL